jgi:hypothetical protein
MTTCQISQQITGTNTFGAFSKFFTQEVHSETSKSDNFEIKNIQPLLNIGSLMLQFSSSFQCIFVEQTQSKFVKIYNEELFCALASEVSLAKEWLSPEEDEAWEDL